MVVLWCRCMVVLWCRCMVVLWCRGIVVMWCRCMVVLWCRCMVVMSKLITGIKCMTLLQFCFASEGQVRRSVNNISDKVVAYNFSLA